MSLLLEPVVERDLAFKLTTLWLAVSEPEVLPRIRIELGQPVVKLLMSMQLHVNCANLFDAPTGGVLVWQAVINRSLWALPNDTLVMRFNWGDI